MNKELEMTPNVLVEFLQKPASEFTKEDIIRYGRRPPGVPGAAQQP